MMMMTTVYVLCMTLRNVPLVWRHYLGLYSKESMKSEMVPVNVPDKKCDCYQCFKVVVPKAVSKGKYCKKCVLWSTFAASFRAEQAELHRPTIEPQDYEMVEFFIKRLKLWMGLTKTKEVGSALVLVDFM